MDIQINDILNMKKKHPCKKENSDKFRVIRVGMDIRLECLGCGHQMMLSREKTEKNIKKIIRT